MPTPPDTWAASQVKSQANRQATPQTTSCQWIIALRLATNDTMSAALL